MKIGDRVRFLSETGGGKVAGFKGNNVVLVEDEDGFQIPTSINDVIVVGQDDYSTSRVVANKSGDRQQASPVVSQEGKSIKAMLNEGLGETEETASDDDPSDKEISYRKPEEERKGGNQLTAFVAFVPMDIHQLSNTRFETYFVNDSNYYLHFVYLTAEGANWRLRQDGEVEPNTKTFLEEVGFDDLNDLTHACVQMVAYKRRRSFVLKPVIDVQFRIDPVKFYKLHTFQENPFFETPALLFKVVENDVPARPLVVDSRQLKKEMYGATETVGAVGIGKKMSPYVHHRGVDDAVVVDLHADQLLDTTVGMSNADILNYQLKVFRDTLAQYAQKKGQKVIFIHGKGDGVLRRAIINDLRYRYKNYSYQDASFQEYGYGATQVTVR